MTKAERAKFMAVASKCDDEIASFCRLMCETGCRISEALALCPRHIDEDAGVIVIESLKKKRAGDFRAVPISPDLIRYLKRLTATRRDNEPIWHWCRMTGYRRIKEIMSKASIVGPQASPKGLRHSFAVAAISSGVPLNLVQRWLGHADMATTAIYTYAVGDEEREMAKRMWESWPAATVN